MSSLSRSATATLAPSASRSVSRTASSASAIASSSAVASSSIAASSSVAESSSAAASSSSVAPSSSQVASSSDAASASESASLSASESASVSASAAESSSIAASSIAASLSASESISASAAASASVSESLAASSSAASASQSSSVAASSASASSASSTGVSTSFVYETITNGGSSVTRSTASTVSTGGAGSGSSSGSNTGAIAGGVVGGVLGLLAILGLLWFFLIKRRKSKQHAFDEKTFDPRHSTHDPLDLLAPSVPDMGAGGATTGAGAASSTVDPYPYDPSGGGYSYDAYNAQPSMEMPDARNYAPGTGGGYPAYGNEGGYGVAAALGAGAAGAGAYGASRGYQPGQQSNTDYSQYSTSEHGHASGANTSPPPPMTAAQMKQREAANERARNRQSPQYGSYAGQHGYGQNYGDQAGGSGSPEESDPANRRQSQALSDGVYQHTDYGSAQGVEEEEAPAEIPPNYHSIRK